MTDTLALEDLYDRAVARMGAQGIFGSTPDAATAAALANTFGWKEPNHQLGPTSRIVWVPGDPTGGVGEIGPPRYPGRLPARPIATLHETFYVDIQGYDPTAPDNERAQWKATRLLLDAWIAAVYIVAHGTFTLERPQWLTDKNERRFGATVRVVGTIESMVPDEQLPQAVQPTNAVIAVTDLDTTESVTAP